MKRLFIVLCLAATIVSCGETKRDFYFESLENRVYNDPSAEFDTLSYAIGMNMGLSMVLHPAGNIFDIDIIMKSFDEELSKSEVDKEFLKVNAEYLQRFYNEKLQSYIMARRFAANKNENTFKPSVFDNGEYSVEKVSQAFGYDMANHTRKSSYPANVYWMMRAIEDAKKVESESIVDDYMALDVMTFRRVMSDYFTSDFPNYMSERGGKWFERVSKQRNVKMMVVEGDTLYYRIDKAGNGKHPQSLRDTVSFNYDVYTMSGNLVESHDQRVETLKTSLAEAMADTTSTPEMREMRVERLKSQLEKTENLRIVLERAMIKGSQYGIQKVSEGGDITLWIPASLAYGSRGNKVVAPNEPIVMTIHLNSVAYGPTDEEIEAEKMLSTKFNKGLPVNPNGKQSVINVKPHSAQRNDESGKGVKVMKPNPQVVTVKPVNVESGK